MEKNLKFYWKLFLSTFYISAFTFGGGYVIVPLMKKRFVEDYKWIEEEEMLDMIAIAQSSPGPIAVNTSIIIGYRLGGITGALITVLGTVTPPLVILSLVSLVYGLIIDNFAVKCVLRGMQIGVAAVIVDVVMTMVAQVIRKKKVLPIIIMLLAFVAAFFVHINIVMIILLSGCLGASELLFYKFKKKGVEEKK